MPINHRFNHSYGWFFFILTLCFCSACTSIENGGVGDGFVNTAANASSSPSGYTGLQLDNGTTNAGNASFVSTSGSTETGHAGNGYARVTRPK